MNPNGNCEWIYIVMGKMSMLRKISKKLYCNLIWSGMSICLVPATSVVAGLTFPSLVQSSLSSYSLAEKS